MAAAAMATLTTIALPIICYPFARRCDGRQFPPIKDFRPVRANWSPIAIMIRPVPRDKGGRKEDYFVPTQDFVTNQPGIGLFYRLAYAPEDRNPWNTTISGGIGARGIIPGRHHDRMGVGVYSMLVSEDLNRQPVVGGILGDEVGVEAFYNFAITPSQQLSADAQYIKLGVTLNDDAFVAGTRLFTRF